MLFRSDIVTIQEVRAPDELVPSLVAEITRSPKSWHVAHHESRHKGRAGVAVASNAKKAPIVATRNSLSGSFDSTGRWIEADIDTADGKGLTVNIIDDSGVEVPLTLPTGSKLKVKDGDSVEAGQLLTDGPIDPKELLEISGIRDTQNYIVDEVQKV